MHDDYYQVVFKSEDDYKHALFEGPRKVASWSLFDRAKVAPTVLDGYREDSKGGCLVKNSKTSHLTLK